MKASSRIVGSLAFVLLTYGSGGCGATVFDHQRADYGTGCVSEGTATVSRYGDRGRNVSVKCKPGAVGAYAMGAYGAGYGSTGIPLGGPQVITAGDMTASPSSYIAHAAERSVRGPTIMGYAADYTATQPQAIPLAPNGATQAPAADIAQMRRQLDDATDLVLDHDADIEKLKATIADEIARMEAKKKVEQEKLAQTRLMIETIEAQINTLKAS